MMIPEVEAVPVVGNGTNGYHDGQNNGSNDDNYRHNRSSYSDGIMRTAAPDENDGGSSSSTPVSFRHRLPQQEHYHIQQPQHQQQQNSGIFSTPPMEQHYQQQQSPQAIGPLPPSAQHHQYIPQQQPYYYQHQHQSSSIWRRICNMTTFCYCVQIVNCALVCALIALAIQEYPKIEALEAQVEDDKAEIEQLEQEVREKQEVQIQELQGQVKEEQEFNFLTLAGTFTLLTCLVSMFHMSSHLQKMNSPNIQRKIIAILWMSPIYSVTSFLTLWFPSIGGWMAIIKDFYEAYCIYTFLSFLIAVLGHGDRDQAVDVLSKHASHLETPTRCLSCFYDPSPDVSDHAKANAVVTQCQIYCLQFTFIRPITTIIYVLLNRGAEGGATATSESNSTTTSSNSASTSDNSSSSSSSNSENGSNGSSSSTSPSTATETSEGSSSNSHGTTTGSNHTGGVRWLANSQDGGNITSTTTVDSNNGNNNDNDDGTGVVGTTPSDSPQDNGDGDDNNTNENQQGWIPAPAPIQEAIGTLAPTIVSNLVPTIAPTLAVLVPTIAGSGNNNITTIPTATSIVDESPTEDETDAIVKSTEAYFKSPGFALAMVVNVSVFFAFSGLLKFYHAVRDDLQWIRPWPKFLSIKAVVFLTFWQGLMILIFVVVLADPSEKVEATAQAHLYQNLLICLEMLLFSIWQWCVFPAEEWEPNYQPKEMHNPGLGIKDFAKEVGTIMQKGTKKTRRGRKRNTRRKSNRLTVEQDYSGVYQRPGNIAEQYDEHDYSNDDDDDDHSNDLGTDSEHTSTAINDEGGIEMSPQKRSVQFGNLPPSTHPSNGGDRVYSGIQNDSFHSQTSGESGHCFNRDRTLSDGTGNRADDEFDSDMDML